MVTAMVMIINTCYRSCLCLEDLNLPWLWLLFYHLD